MKTTRILGILALALLVVPAVAAKHTVTIKNAGDAAPGTYTLNVDVANFNLVDFSTKTAANNHVKGEGHIHYLLNGAPCDTSKGGELAEKCDASTPYATDKKAFTYKNLKAGDKVQAELVLSDHSASGTNSASELDGSRVLSSEVTVAGAKSSPGVGPLMLLGILGLAFVISRRK